MRKNFLAKNINKAHTQKVGKNVKQEFMRLKQYSESVERNLSMNYEVLNALTRVFLIVVFLFPQFELYTLFSLTKIFQLQIPWTLSKILKI